MSISDAYESHDATALAALVAAGEVTPEELLDEALKRAEALNPKLNALTGLRPDVARRMIAEGLPDGPFRGVPFLLKDLGAEAADFPGNNGSRLLENTVYPVDSHLYQRLRAAGLVTFGRTTSPEGGIGPVTEAAVYGGPTRSPWNLERTSGGSSGGSGSAVAARIVPAAHGSDGGGSIRIPASSCGLFGYKASRGRMPDGPYSGEGWAGMAMDGFLTRSVRDSAGLMDAAAGPDLGAPYFAPPLRGTYLEATRRAPGRLRVGFLTTTFTGAPIHPECRAGVEAAARLFENLGHDVFETTVEADHADMMAAWTIIVACGTALWVSKAAKARGRSMSNADIEPVARAACDMAAGLSGADYLDAVGRIHAYGRRMAASFADKDVILSSTLAEPPAQVGRFAHADRHEDFSTYRNGPDGVFAYSPFTATFNASGQPAASLPLHMTADGLPVGVHVAMPVGEDEALMSLCAQVETAAPWADRRPASPLS